ncbi:MAG: FHIPEP family type III secretion protein, partial [candidate division Zixibacteria bacterium]|nr:FHIPEP family type III secretion protein [candidate division Zixibacteria bacterium]
GGLIIGVVQRDMPLDEALRTYTVLTVGDGLVSQIPALLISTAAGIIVTRATSGGTLGSTMSRQLFAKPRANYVAGCILVLLGLVPGMPMLPFVLLGVTNLGIGYVAQGAIKNRAMAKAKANPKFTASLLMK